MITQGKKSFSEAYLIRQHFAVEFPFSVAKKGCGSNSECFGTPKILKEPGRFEPVPDVQKRQGTPESLQLFVFLLRCDQHRQIYISIFPECEEILISLARFGCVAAD